MFGALDEDALDLIEVLGSPLAEVFPDIDALDDVLATDYRLGSPLEGCFSDTL